MKDDCRNKLFRKGQDRRSFRLLLTCKFIAVIYKTRAKSPIHELFALHYHRRIYLQTFLHSLKNIKSLIDLCDILHVYDNTNEPIRIIRKHKETFSAMPCTISLINRYAVMSMMSLLSNVLKIPMSAA